MTQMSSVREMAIINVLHEVAYCAKYIAVTLKASVGKMVDIFAYF